MYVAECYTIRLWLPCSICELTSSNRTSRQRRPCCEVNILFLHKELHVWTEVLFVIVRFSCADGAIGSVHVPVRPNNNRSP